MITKNTHRFEFKMGRVGVTLFVLGMSGMLFGVFLLGITLGKNIDTYPEKIARFLPDKIKLRIGLPLEAATPVVVVGDDRKLPDDKALQDKILDEEPDLTFYDTLGKHKNDTRIMVPEDMIPKKEAAGGVKEQMAVQPQSQNALQASSTTPVKPGLQQKEPVLPAPVQKIPSVKEKEAREVQFVIQVVSYREKVKADALARKIAAQGYPAQTEVMELPDKGKWFRVMVGVFLDRQDAEKALGVISKKNSGLTCVIRPVAANKPQ